MNVKFILRAVLLAVPLAVVLSAGWLLLQTPFGKLPEPTPPPPTILAPAGEPPPGPVGLQEWVRYRDEGYRLAGCGFFLSLPRGGVVAVTTAHSVAAAGPSHPLERIALSVAGQAGFVAEFESLVGSPGRPLEPNDLTIDYLLLKVDQPIDSELVLPPDPRGAPQPGERVSLVSGLGDGRGDLRILEGTVQSVNARAIWVLMDQRFNPGMMSGSPFLSQHTGKAVGMAVAARPRGTRLLLGMHPIASLVRLAGSTDDMRSLEQVNLASD